MAKRKQIYADDALEQGLDLEVAPTVRKEITADSQGRYVGQNGLTVDNLDMVGTGQFFNNTDWNQMGNGYSMVVNPYQAASPEQIAQRQQAGQVSTTRNDMELMGDDSYNLILQHQKDFADAQARGDQAAMDAAHAAAEAVREKYGYSGGADGSEYLGLMAYTGGLSDYDSDSDGGRGAGGFQSPGYLSKYQARIDALANAILNRDPFSYNKDEDPLYQQYKESYTRGGQRGMQDTLAQVSARTGGLASSYAQSAAQQTYNNYMAELANKVPELYQLAYSMYMDDIAMDRADLSMLQGLDDTAYGRWSDNRNFDYGMYRDGVADSQWQQQFDYGVSRDQVADSQWQQQFDYQKQQDALAREDALNKLLSGGGGGSSSGYGGGGALSTIYGMGNEAEVYDYLVSQGMSKAEVENYMNYWKQNANDQAYDAYLNGPQGNESDGSYKFVDDELKSMLREGYDPGEVMQRLEVAYDRDLLTREEYLELKKKYQD